MSSNSLSDLAGLKSLKGLAEIRFYPSLSSTNDEALAWAAAGARDLSLVVADEQTAGRGRMGRQWFTPPGSALAFSLILRPQGAEREMVGLFSGLGALALVDALRRYGVPAQIKWPNDVLINRQKVAGILVENVWMGTEVESVVLGIGINVAPASVPPSAGLNFPATCVQAEGQSPVPRLALLQTWLEALQPRRAALASAAFIRDWESLLAFRGELVRVWLDATETVTGQLLGLEPDGSLRIKTETGTERIMRFGEVHLRPV